MKYSGRRELLCKLSKLSNLMPNLSQNVCKPQKFNNPDGILILRKYFRYETTNFAPKGQGSARSL